MLGTIIAMYLGMKERERMDNGIRVNLYLEKLDHELAKKKAHESYKTFCQWVRDLIKKEID